jgi:hypothetical protein
VVVKQGSGRGSTVCSVMGSYQGVHVPGQQTCKCWCDVEAKAKARVPSGCTAGAALRLVFGSAAAPYRLPQRLLIVS